MKRRTASFTGTRPIFTGSPSIVQGGFNLDVTTQNFAVGDVIPAGTLAIKNEETRKVQIIKTAKVVDVAEDHKTVTLHVDEFYVPCFSVGDKVLKLPISGNYSDVPAIAKIEAKGETYIITLDKAAATGWRNGDVIEQVVDGSPAAKEIGKANCVTIYDVEVSEFETGIDVSADTMQYAMYELRVAPIPATQKNESGDYLVANPHVKLTKSH